MDHVTICHYTSIRLDLDQIRPGSDRTWMTLDQDPIRPRSGIHTWFRQVKQRSPNTSIHLIYPPAAVGGWSFRFRERLVISASVCLSDINVLKHENRVLVQGEQGK